jgi:hypothetical protein
MMLSKQHSYGWYYRIQFSLNRVPIEYGMWNNIVHHMAMFVVNGYICVL